MEKYKFRREKLRSLVDSTYGGVVAALAKAADINPSYVSRMLYPDEKPGRKRIGEDMVEKIEGIHPDWLSDNKWQSIDEMENSDVFFIKQHHDVYGAMGKGLILRDQPGRITELGVTSEWMTKNMPFNTGKVNLCIVTGFGDSMQGMFNSGDPLIVDTGVRVMEYDGVYFFRVGDEGFIKRLQRIPGEGIRVISKNPDYETWTIKDGMDFEVFGRVIKVWKGENI